MYPFPKSLITSAMSVSHTPCFEEPERKIKLQRTASSDRTQAYECLKAVSWSSNYKYPRSPEFTPRDFLPCRNLWNNTAQLEQKQILTIFAVKSPSQKTQVQLVAENIWSDYRSFQLEIAKRVIGSCTRRFAWYHFHLTYLYTSSGEVVTNGLTWLRVGRFLIVSLMWTWKRFLLMSVSRSNCCHGYKSFIAPHWPTAEYKEWVYYVQASMTNTQTCSSWNVPPGSKILLVFYCRSYGKTVK